jgi:hypothetical protein
MLCTCRRWERVTARLIAAIEDSGVHAALSLWLSVTGAPAEVAARAGNSVHVLQDVYAHCIDGRQDVVSRQIEDALDLDCDTLRGSQCVTASGYTHRRYRPDPVRHMSVNDPGRPTDGPQFARLGTPGRSLEKRPPMTVSAVQKAPGSALCGDCGRPNLAHAWPTTKANGLLNRSLSRRKPVTQDHVTGFDLRECVAGVGFEPT